MLRARAEPIHPEIDRRTDEVPLLLDIGRYIRIVPIHDDQVSTLKAQLYLTYLVLHKMRTIEPHIIH